MKEYKRNCPQCKKELICKDGYYWRKANELNRVCWDCHLTNLKSTEWSQRSSEAQKKRFNDPKIRKQISDSKNKFYKTKAGDRTKKKMSKARKGRFTGKDNFFFGKHHSEETKK